MQVNSAHHQAVREPGPHAVVNAVAADSVIEGMEDPRYRFCLGVQWHPEFVIDPGDRRIFDALIAACRDERGASAANASPNGWPAPASPAGATPRN